MDVTEINDKIQEQQKILDDLTQQKHEAEDALILAKWQDKAINIIDLTTESLRTNLLSLCRHLDHMGARDFVIFMAPYTNIISPIVEPIVYINNVKEGVYITYDASGKETRF